MIIVMSGTESTKNEGVLNMILFVDACVREGSRTERLARYLLEKLQDPVIEELHLAEVCFPITDGNFIAERDRFIAEDNFSDPLFDLAKQFAGADIVVIAAPFWDLSFPAALKQYFEQINVTGITFCYDESGVPKGLCKAKKLYYVTTAGGPIFSDEYGYGYVRELAQTYYGIPETELIKAESLDIIGADVEHILREAEIEIDSSFRGLQQGKMIQ